MCETIPTRIATKQTIAISLFSIVFLHLSSTAACSTVSIDLFKRSHRELGELETFTLSQNHGSFKRKAEIMGSPHGGSNLIHFSCRNTLELQSIALVAWEANDNLTLFYLHVAGTHQLAMVERSYWWLHVVSPYGQLCLT